VAIGTDTGGSVRLPAAWCGHVGLKTSLGRISVHGVLPLAESLDTPGPMTRSVEDAALLYAALSGPDLNDPLTYRPAYTDPMPALKQGIEGMRIARMPDHDRVGVDDEVLAAYDEALRVLERAGAHILSIELPEKLADMADPLGQIIYAEGYAHYSHLIDDPNAPLDEDVRPRLATGRSISSKDYLLAKRDQQRCIRAFHAAMADVDILLTPTTATPAPVADAIDQKTTPALFTRAVNMAEMCACAVPSGFSKAGLPLSVQFVARYGAEDVSLRAAWAYEQARGFSVGAAAMTP
jgi:aspartyl-tRNA(Asn)/glutamyl-tRNA(Gln) amidotransferase subunit A